MRHLTATVAGVVLLLTPLVGAAQPPDRTTAPVAPNAARANWEKDLAAVKPFYDFGFRCGKGRGPEGLDVEQAYPVLQAHIPESVPSGDLTSYRTPLERLLVLLSVFGIARSEAPDAQEARARFPQIAEAYRLYNVLNTAPLDQQQLYVAAFEAGLSSGRGRPLQRVLGPMAAAAKKPRPAHAERRAGIVWQRDPRAKTFYRFGVASLQGGDWPYTRISSLKKRAPALTRERGLFGTLSLMDDRVWTLETSLLYLSILYGADSEAPDVRRARAQQPLMREARRLYQVLKKAPPARQAIYAAALQAAYARGGIDNQPRFDPEMDKRRAAERRRLQAHRQLTKALLARTSDERLGEAVMDFAINKIGDHWDRDYEIVTSLPKPIQLVFAMFRMKNEVDSEGFQHFLECDSWRFAPLAAEGYRLVGSKKRAAVMERAITVMAQEKAKANAEVPHSDEDADEDGEEEVEDGNPALLALSDEFHEVARTEDMYRLIAQYIRRYPEKFVAK